MRLGSVDDSRRDCAAPRTGEFCARAGVLLFEVEFENIECDRPAVRSPSCPAIMTLRPSLDEHEEDLLEEAPDPFPSTTTLPFPLPLPLPLPLLLELELELAVVREVDTESDLDLVPSRKGLRGGKGIFAKVGRDASSASPCPCLCPCPCP